MRAALRSQSTIAKARPRMRASRAPRRQDHRPSPTAARLCFRHDSNSIVAPHDARITTWSKPREFRNTGSDGKFQSAALACAQQNGPPGTTPTPLMTDDQANPNCTDMKAPDEVPEMELSSIVAL